VISTNIHLLEYIMSIFISTTQVLYTKVILSPTQNYIMFIQKHLKSIIVAIIIAISLYIITAIAIGWNDSITLIKKISAVGWLSLMTCSFISYLIRYARWYYFIKKLGHVISHKLHFLSSLRNKFLFAVAI